MREIPGNEQGGGEGNGDGDRDGNYYYNNYYYYYCCGGYPYNYYCGSFWWGGRWGNFWYPIYCNYYPGYYYWDYFPYYWSNYSNYWDYWGGSYWGRKSHAAYSTGYPYVEEYAYPEEEEEMLPPLQGSEIPSATASAMEFLNDGAERFKEGKYLESLSFFRRAKLTDIDSGIPKFLYAQTLFALGIYDAAADEIRLGLTVLPDWPERGGDIKLLYGEDKDFEEQLSALKTYLRLSPGDEDALLVLAYATYFSGDLYMAEKALEKLKYSSVAVNATVAEIFLMAIRKIKERLPDMDEKPVSPEDRETIEDLLGR